MEKQEMERIARATLRDLGLPRAELTVSQVDGRPGYWNIAIMGRSQPLKIRCGEGSSPQWVREQICDQYNQ